MRNGVLNTGEDSLLSRVLCKRQNFKQGLASNVAYTTGQPSMSFDRRVQK